MFEYDYFGDYSDFEAQVEQFKDSLRDSVKDEVKKKIEKLETRNRELEEKQKNLSNLEKEYTRKLKELKYEKENEIKNVKNEIYNSTIREIVDRIFKCENLYEIDYKKVKKPKCNLCDENRIIIVKDIFGRNHEVKCCCDEDNRKYFYRKSDTQISIWKNKDSSIINLCVKTYKSFYDSYEREIIIDYATKDKDKDRNFILEKFDENNLPENYRNAYFTNEKEAQKYVDYLNAKEKEDER